MFISSALVQELFAQSGSFVVYDTIPIRSGTSKFKLYKNINKWFETERGTKLIAKSRKDLKFKGKGYFIYYNHVKLPDIFLSPHANERCKGSISFSIDITIQDSIIVSKFTNFVHEAVYSEYGSMTFGKLMDYEKVPPGTCMEVEEWCNAVWADMKTKSTEEIKARTSRMIPKVLIRKRTYKAKEVVKEKIVEVKEDPNEYLKLENYLIKEDKKEKEAEDLKEQEEKADKEVNEEKKDDAVKTDDSQKVEETQKVEEKKEAPKEVEKVEDTKKTKKSKVEDSEEVEEKPKVEEKKKEEKPKEDKKAKGKGKTQDEEDEYDDE